MKHITRVTREVPADAALWQEIFCQFNDFLRAMLDSFGGSSPILDFFSGKCDLPDGGDV